VRLIAQRPDVWISDGRRAFGGRNVAAFPSSIDVISAEVVASYHAQQKAFDYLSGEAPS
jgi:hypothetical protein